MPYAGSRFDVTQPGAGEVTRLPVVLLDDDGAPVTGETFDAAGMDVEVAKPGGTFADFPTFATENWHEIGRGVYEIIIRGDDATEAALLDTEGTFLVYVKTDASSANTALHAFKVSPYDVAREGADGDTLETLSDQLDNTALEATLEAMQGATFNTSTDSLEAIRDRGDIAWLASAGSGVRTVVFTLSDGAGTLAVSLKCQVEDGNGNLVAGPLTTDSLGQVTFFLDDAEGYEFVTPSTAVWQGAAQEFDVSASGSQAITLTAQSLPTPSDADKYTIILNAADEYGNLVGADAWTVKVTDVRPRRLATANLVQLSEENAITIDGNGQGSFEISKETTQFTVEITPTLANATTGETVTITAIVDSDAANDSDQIYLADLQFIE